MERLISFSEIDELITSAIWTGNVEDTIPISILLVSEPGMAKSKCLISFRGNSIHHATDITTAGLLEMLEQDKQQKIRHIVLPDLNAILSHKSSTSNLTFGTFLSLMTEGIARIDDGRRIKDVNHVVVGLLIAITTDMFEAKFRQWNSTGFRRRFLPIFFDYSTKSTAAVRSAISQGKVTLKSRDPISIELPDKYSHVIIKPEIAAKIEPLAVSLSQKLATYPGRHRDKETRVIYVRPTPGRPVVEFTPHLQLLSLSKGRARSKNRSIVTTDDVDWLQSVIDFCEYGRPKQL